MDTEDILFLIFLAISLIGGISLGVSIGKHQCRKEAISLGHAQYNPTNATFEWKEIK